MPVSGVIYGAFIMKAIKNVTLKLVEEFPELQPAFQEHLEDHGGELLAYVFLADVERWAEKHVTTDPVRVKELLRWLDKAYLEGDCEVQNWIALGFVEVLPRPREEPQRLRELLGPVLKTVALELG